MSRARQLVIAAVMLALLVSGVAWIFSLRVASGEVYPAYSSLRADGFGTRAWHDALAQMPEMKVTREFRPIARWKGGERSVRFILGADWREWKTMPESKFDALAAAAGNGSRIVVTFFAVDGEAVKTWEESLPGKKQKEREEKAEKKAKEERKKAPRPGFKEVVPKKIADEWGVTLDPAWVFSRDYTLDALSPAELPAPKGTKWRSDLHFTLAKDSGWRVLYRRAGNPVLIEKRFGAGSIVLMAESYPLSNESLHTDRATPLLSWLLGDHTRVVFVESELGVVEETGVGALARRYGLGGALAVLLLLAALYLWRRLVEFVPRNLDERAATEAALAHEPTAGMVALLQRSLKPKQLLAACVEEWRKAKQAAGAKRPADERLEAAWREQAAADAAAKAKTLTETYNALVRARKPR